MPRQHPGRYWLLSAAAVVALLALLTQISDYRFENSDDALILKAFMGFEGGVPANFSLYLHTLPAWAFYALSLWRPDVPWFSLFQLALVGLSGVVSVKCLMQLASGYRRPWLAGGLAGMLVLAVFFAYTACRLNYTTTAALAGAASVLQFIAATDTRRAPGRYARGLLPAVLLLIAAYCLRAQSVYPTVAYLALAFLWRLAERGVAGRPKASLRPLLLSAAAIVLALLMLAGIRAAEIRLRDLQPDIDWHEARTRLMDYTAFEADPAPAMTAATGLSAAEVSLIRQWFFMDSAITADTLNTMADAYTDGPQTGVFGRLTDFFEQNPRQLWAACLLLPLCGFCWLASRRPGRLAAAAATLAVLGTGAMLVFLTLRGRLLPRAADTVLMPALATACGLALTCRSPFSGGTRLRRAAALALAALTLAGGALQARATLYCITRAPDTVSMQREADLERFALDHPDLLVVRGPNLLRDTRLLPDVSGGTPGNILLWGDWTCHTPGWDAQLARYGLNPKALSADDWLGDTLVFAAASPTEPDALCAWLTDALVQPVTARPLSQQGTLIFFRFQVSR